MVAIVVITATACGGDPGGGQEKKPAAVGRLTVIAEIPHDTTAYTEGLASDGSALYESTGQLGQSQLRQLNPVDGAVIRSVPLAPDFFGEGITVVGDRIWQLTYHNGVAIEWDKASFTQLRQVPFTGEGWGLCYDGKRLISSDGTDQLRFRDPTSFAETGSVSVTSDGKPQRRLNELECVDGQVWANVYLSDQIVRIDPTTGQITATVDAKGLLDPARKGNAEVLNGIAYVGDSQFLVTGKYWPAMFRVKFDLG